MSIAAAVLAGCTNDPGLPNTGPSDTRREQGRPSATRDLSTSPEWVVTLGDSYISGDGARWAGNTQEALRRVDALGPDAYADHDLPRTQQSQCRRAKESIAQLDLVNVRGRNLACSGATLRSRSEKGAFKPGIDSYGDDSGHRGQLVALRRFAGSHDVSAIVLSIGGNDLHFGSALARCVTGFLFTAGGQPQHCSEDPEVTSSFSAARVRTVSRGIAAALGRVSAVMSSAGYRSEDFRLLTLTYPSPVPSGPELRYPETLKGRYTVGGCPLFDADATWAATALRAINTAVRSGVRRSGLPNAALLDMSRAFEGHRLCERGVGQLEEVGLSSWRDPAAADRLEWVNKLTVSWLPWQSTGAVHPGYFGMLAERACLRQALLAPAAPVSRCVISDDGSRAGKPVMTLR